MIAFSNKSGSILEFLFKFKLRGDPTVFDDASGADSHAGYDASDSSDFLFRSRVSLRPADRTDRFSGVARPTAGPGLRCAAITAPRPLGLEAVLVSLVELLSGGAGLEKQMALNGCLFSKPHLSKTSEFDKMNM